MEEVVKQQTGLLQADLQMLRDENVVLESERDPEFRRRVGSEVVRAKADAERIGRTVGNSP
jgi:hypothetical protein